MPRLPPYFQTLASAIFFFQGFIFLLAEAVGLPWWWTSLEGQSLITSDLATTQALSDFILPYNGEPTMNNNRCWSALC